LIGASFYGGGQLSKEDRHQAVYIPFRCSKETGDTIARLARESHRLRSEIARGLLNEGLKATGAVVDDDYLYELVKRAVKEIMKPQVERLAAISVKSTQISSAAYFMSIEHEMVPTGRKREPCCMVRLFEGKLSIYSAP